MKRIVYFLLALTLVFSLCACDSEGKGGSTGLPGIVYNGEIDGYSAKIGVDGNVAAVQIVDIQYEGSAKVTTTTTSIPYTYYVADNQGLT